MINNEIEIDESELPGVKILRSPKQEVFGYFAKHKYGTNSLIAKETGLDYDQVRKVTKRLGNDGTLEFVKSTLSHHHMKYSRVQNVNIYFKKGTKHGKKRKSRTRN